MAKYGRKQELRSANYRVYEVKTYTHCDLTKLEIFENFQQKPGENCYSQYSIQQTGVSGLFTPSQARVSLTENAWEEAGGSLSPGKHHLEEHSCKGEEETRVTGGVNGDKLSPACMLRMTCRLYYDVRGNREDHESKVLSRYQERNPFPGGRALL